MLIVSQVAGTVNTYLSHKSQNCSTWVHCAKRLTVYELLQVMHKVAVIGDFAVAVGVEQVLVPAERGQPFAELT